MSLKQLPNLGHAKRSTFTHSIHQQVSALGYQIKQNELKTTSTTKNSLTSDLNRLVSCLEFYCDQSTQDQGETDDLIQNLKKDVQTLHDFNNFNYQRVIKQFEILLQGIQDRMRKDLTTKKIIDFSSHGDRIPEKTQQRIKDILEEERYISRGKKGRNGVRNFPVEESRKKRMVIVKVRGYRSLFIETSENCYSHFKTLIGGGKGTTDKLFKGAEDSLKKKKKKKTSKGF